MTDNEAIHEARRRAFRAIDETCPTVQSICDDADIDCGVDHDDASGEIESVHSEIECQLGTLQDIASRLGRASDYASVDDIPSAILDRVTGPFREALIEAYRDVVTLEDEVSDKDTVVAALEESRASYRRARFVIRMHNTMRRRLAAS